MTSNAVATLSCPLQVEDFRLSSQFFEEARGAAACGQARDFTFRIAQIAKHHGFGRTRLYARGLHVSVRECTFFALRLRFRSLDPLNAERTFLHDSALTNGDIGVMLKTERRRPDGIEPIEEAH